MNAMINEVLRRELMLSDNLTNDVLILCWILNMQHGITPYNGSVGLQSLQPSKHCKQER